MNTFLQTFSHRIFGLAKTVTVIVAMTAMTACASVSSMFRTADSSLPIQTIDSTGGEIASTRAFESSDRLYVGGTMRRAAGSHIPTLAHVDVQLVDSNGKVIAEKQDDIEPAHPRSSLGRNGRHSYVASFPLPEARRAAKIVVRYHLAGHKS